MNAKGKILIIDDNEDVLFALNLLLDPYVEKIKVTTQPTRIEHFMTTFQPDVILLDMNFRRDAISGQEGFDCLEQILKLDPQAIVLFMTAYIQIKQYGPLRLELLTLFPNLGKKKNYLLRFHRLSNFVILVKRSGN